jgi:ribonuclease HI
MKEGASIMKKRKRVDSRDKLLLDIIKRSDEQLILDEKGTVIICTDASVQSVSDDEYRSGLGVVIFYRKKKKFGVKLIAECEYKSEKDDIGKEEYKALKRGISEAMGTWDFDQAYVLSDSTSALKRLTKEIKDNTSIPFDINLYWVESHKGILLNALADHLAKNRNVEQFASVDEALVVPDANPFAKYRSYTGIKGGMKRAYRKNERQKAFQKLLKSIPNTNIYKSLLPR